MLDDPLVPRREPTFKDEALKREEAAGVLTFAIYRNDGTSESYEVLTGLKNVFQKQLPKMPKEYITRLVYDRRHESLAIIKNPERRVVGGICYRLFPADGFCEIVFCAIASSDQVKGFGAYLMCHLKEHIRLKHPSIEHFLTYADNYAVGYFRKQGFTATVTLDRSRWAGRIKDYDGGTLMQCSMVPGIDYLDWYRTIWTQQAALVRLLHDATGVGRVYEGIRAPMNVTDVPGVAAAGWNESMSAAAAGIHSPSARKRLAELLRPLLSSLQSHPASWPFRKPVDIRDVPDYPTVIQHPMDLATMQSRVDATSNPAPAASSAVRAYESIEGFIADFNLIIANCRTYNDADTTYCKNATLLERFFKERIEAIRSQLTD